MSTNSGLPKGLAINVNQWLNGSKLNAFHAFVFVLSLGIISFDGYDLFIYAGAIPLVMKEFHMNPAQAGAIASYMLMGAAIGALALGSLADNVGRKNALMFYIALFSVAMFLTALTTNSTTFAICRFLTGLGVGGSLPNVSALATEFIPGKKRALMISMIYAGISIGGMAAALLGILLFPHYGWRSVFYLGGLPILALPIYIKWLPESPVRLVRRNRLAELSIYRQRARPAETVPADATFEIDKAASKAPIAAIFQEKRAFSTILFWVIWFMNVYVIFGFTIWLPKLIMGHGFSLATGLTFLFVMSVAGIIGSFVVGALADLIVFHCSVVSTFDLTMEGCRKERIEKASGKPATATSAALIAAYRQLEAKKIVLISPYIKATNELEIAFLGHHQITVLHDVGLEIAEGSRMGLVDPGEWYRTAITNRCPEADAYFLSCTAIRTAPIIAALESELGKPVVTSNQAMAWHALRTAGIRDSIAGYGTLLSRF